MLLLHSRTARAANDGVLRLCAVDAFALQCLVSVHVGMDKALADQHTDAQEQETNGQDAADKEKKSEHSRGGRPMLRWLERFRDMQR